MLKLVSIFICLISFQAFGQQEKSFKIQDFNHDGVVDTLRSFYEGGSGFGGNYVRIINGKSNEIYELNTHGCFCSIKKIISIPPALTDPGNIFFLEAMTKEIFPGEKNIPDASLQWIIEGSYSTKELNRNHYFDMIIDPQIKWNDGEIKLPYTYYILLKGDTLKKLYNTDDELVEWFDKHANKGFLIYYGHNHYRNPSGDSLSLVTGNKTYTIYRTSHGVLAKKDSLFKWLFVSDKDLTGAPGKLRWESIGKIRLIENYVIIHEELPPLETDNIFVVNIETGICGKLKIDHHEVEFTPTQLTDMFKELEAQSSNEKHD